MRVTTENWLALLAGPKEVHHVLDRLDGEVGFMADFGNWKTTGDAKYDDLASILARSEDTHAKARFPPTTRSTARISAAASPPPRRSAIPVPIR